MADVYGVEYTNIYQTTPPTKSNAASYGGKVRAFICTYEASSLASGSVIWMCKLPKGAVILPQSRLSADALGSGVTLQVGDYFPESTDTDNNARYMAATAYNTANLSNPLSLVDGQGYELPYDAVIIVTTGGAAATGTIKLSLLVSMP